MLRAVRKNCKCHSHGERLQCDGHAQRLHPCKLIRMIEDTTSAFLSSEGHLLKDLLYRASSQIPALFARAADLWTHPAIRDRAIVALNMF